MLFRSRQPGTGTKVVKEVHTSVQDSDNEDEEPALTSEQLKAVTHPSYLENFDEKGGGCCRTCGGSGLDVITDPSDVKTILRHLNDSRSGQGHYSQLMDIIPGLRNVDAQVAGGH